MMGRQTGDQSQLFYLFNLERRIPAGHLLRRINPVVTRLLADTYWDDLRPSPYDDLALRLTPVLSPLTEFAFFAASGRKFARSFCFADRFHQEGCALCRWQRRKLE